MDGRGRRRHLITFRKQRIEASKNVLVMSQGKMLCWQGSTSFGVNPFTPRGHTLEERNLAALNFVGFIFVGASVEQRD